jgi:hypothetical protein
LGPASLLMGNREKRRVRHVSNSSMELSGCSGASRGPAMTDERVMEIDELRRHIVIFSRPTSSMLATFVLWFLAD